MFEVSRRLLFSRGNGNRGGWKNHNGNNNSKNGNYGNRGRGGFAKRNQNNSEYSLFVGGRSNQTKWVSHVNLFCFFLNYNFHVK